MIISNWVITSMPDVQRFLSGSWSSRPTGSSETWNPDWPLRSFACRNRSRRCSALASRQPRPRQSWRWRLGRLRHLCRRRSSDGWLHRLCRPNKAEKMIGFSRLHLMKRQNRSNKKNDKRVANLIKALRRSSITTIKKISNSFSTVNLLLLSVYKIGRCLHFCDYTFENLFLTGLTGVLVANSFLSQELKFCFSDTKFTK